MPRGLARLRTPDHRQNLCGVQVRARRKELRLSQAKLCERLAEQTEGLWNPSIYDLCRIESGRRIVSDIELLALSESLAIDVLSLLFPSEQPLTTV